MWQAIRSASEALCLDDLMLAQAIMEASNISTPSGNLGRYFFGLVAVLLIHYHYILFYLHVRSKSYIGCML